MSINRNASAQAKQQKRDRLGQFAPEGKPAPTAPLSGNRATHSPAEHSQGEDVERILGSLYPNSAVTEDGEIVTSASDLEDMENASHESFEPISDPMRAALLACEELMSKESLSGRIKDQGYKDRNYLPDGHPNEDWAAFDVYAGIEPDLIEDILTLAAKNAGWGSSGEFRVVDFPIDEDEIGGMWGNGTLHCNAEGDTLDGQRGIRLQMAGFEQYDPMYGDKLGWVETSVFYAFPDDDTALALDKEGANTERRDIRR